MQKLIDELETKRPRRNGPKDANDASYESLQYLFTFTIPYRSTNSNGSAKTEPEDSTASTKVMTLQLNGSTNTWSVSED